MLLVLSACSHPAPEEALRKEVGAMRTAVEERDAGALSDGIADDFIGPEGMDRKGARRLAQV
ncbi:MAG TPA: nuclear transport factor 2 family protein, partial [Casimicrobiaceae bacterium]|nr:nuclear transport factor 2 family protein [Casimicrobiaceae bacterium]